jgi:hypothetical protein
MKKIFKNLIMLLFSLAFIFLITEFALRFNAFLEDRKTLAVAMKKKSKIPYNRKVSLGHIIRLSGNDRIIYELQPGLSVFFKGENVTTNSEGFRDDDYSLEKQPHAVRIVGIGDSVMFGLGVPQGSDYLSILERKLNMQFAHKEFEIINMAVPGYNTVQEVETLKEKGLKYRPDIVILGFITNDYALPAFIRDKEDYFSLRKSFLKMFILKRMKRMKSDKNPLLFVENEAELGMPEVNAGMVPELYRDMVGRSAVYNAFRELKELSTEESFTVIALFFTQYRADIVFPSKVTGHFDSEAIQKSSALGFHSIILEPSILRFMQKENIENFLGSVLSVSERDPHPSAFFHEMIAEIIMNDLINQGILKKYVH